MISSLRSQFKCKLASANIGVFIMLPLRYKIAEMERGLAPMATREQLAPNIKYFLDNVLIKQGIVKLEWEKLQGKLTRTPILTSRLTL